jgi:hypothetical protein
MICPECRRTDVFIFGMVTIQGKRMFQILCNDCHEEWVEGDEEE